MKRIKRFADDGSLGFIDALTLLLIGLKLTGTIDWSWLWILSPMWISLAVAIVLAVAVFILESIKNQIEENFTV